MTNPDLAFAAFTAGLADGKPQLVCRRNVITDLDTPVSAYLKLSRDRPLSFLFESVEGGQNLGRYSILTLAPDLVWRCFGEHAETARGSDIAAGRYLPEDQHTLDSLRALVAGNRIATPDDLPPMVGGLFGVFGYDMIRLSEPLGDANADTLGLPDSIVVRPTIVCVFDNLKLEITLATSVWPGAGDAQSAWDAAQRRLDDIEAVLRQPLSAQPIASDAGQPELVSDVSEEAYGDIVERAKEYIACGDIFQVVLSHRFEAPFAQDPFAFYRSLRRLNPSPYMFYLDFGDFQLAGSSPEILIRVRDSKITIRPIAGTRPRGRDEAEDQRLEADLLADPKELSEHLMLLDLGRNDVGRVARPASVKVTARNTIERYSHVMHIVSNVEGEAPADLDPVDALLAALPAGTLSGAPKVRAMEIIDELETVKRGVGYGGGVGYISSSGAIDVCIVLRTALIKDRTIYVQAGAGVVADSKAEMEYAETRHKAGALMKAAVESWRYAYREN